MYINYKDSIVNLANSVLKHFGAESGHDGLKDIDELLADRYKNVVVLLLDGMGVDALEHHLPADGFFRKHFLRSYSSVFPPTTTSATTSLESGLTPFEHGWLGWSLYFRELDKVVDAFVNTEKDSEKQAAEYHVASRFVPYKSIYEKIRETGNGGAYSVSKFGSNRIETFDELTEEVIRLCGTEERKYIYAYWENPDSLMHMEGCYHPLVTENMRVLQDKVEKLCERLSDTLFIVTADHGHCSLEHYVLTDYPDLYEMLERPISVETRAAAFYVKKEHLEEFPILFQKYFGEEFKLFARQEIIEKEIFGVGQMHPRFEEFVGDYMAIAVRDKGIVNSEKSLQLRSNHAGLTAKEMHIPLIVVARK